MRVFRRGFCPEGAPPTPHKLLSFFRVENLDSNVALVIGLMSTYFLFCYSVTRCRTEPVEGKNSSLGPFMSASSMCRNHATPQRTTAHGPHHVPHTHTTRTTRTHTLTFV